jgi:hypothetical protein
MKRLLALLMLPSVAWAGPQNNWTETQRTLQEYLTDGYTVVGFSVAPVETVIPVTAYRFVLQKGTSLVLCSEKVNMNGAQLRTSCSELR